MTRVSNSAITKQSGGVKQFFSDFWKGFSGVFKWVGKNIVPIGRTVGQVASRVAAA